MRGSVGGRRKHSIKMHSHLQAYHDSRATIKKIGILSLRDFNFNPSAFANYLKMSYSRQEIKATLSPNYFILDSSYNYIFRVKDPENVMCEENSPGCNKSSAARAATIKRRVSSVDAGESLRSISQGSSSTTRDSCSVHGAPRDFPPCPQ